MAQEQVLINTLDFILNNIKSGVPGLIREGESKLKEWEEKDLASYAYTLCSYISNSTKDVNNRLLAGLIFKGTLHAKDPSISKEKHERWLSSIPEELKINIRQGLLGTLSTPEIKARQVTAQVISNIALVEIPAGKWPNLIPWLLESITKDQVPPTLKQSALDTIGYICEEIEPEILSVYANQILTAVVHGMRHEEPNPLVKRSACNALFNAMSFCRNNFNNIEERNVLMNVILQATVHPNEDVRVAAYEVLVEVAAVHYDKLVDYIQHIFKVTLEAMKGPSEPTAKQAIEFWCTISDEELSIYEETEYAKEYDLPPPLLTSQNYVRGALQYLIPVLTETLTKQSDEHDDHDEWTLPMAGSTCLGLIAQVVEDEIVGHVMGFIEKNIQHPEWKNREAATLAFGSILEGPTKVIGELITQAVPLFLKHMKDPKIAVRDTTAWTLGRICKMHHQSVMTQAEDILRVMADALGDQPRVASNAAWTIHNIAYSFRDEPSNPLSRFFTEVVTLLLTTSDRKDGDDENLRQSAYEALNVVLSTAPPNQEAALELILGIIYDRLQLTFSWEILSQDDQNKQNEIQGLLCGVLQILITKLNTKIAQTADRMMGLLLLLLKSKNDSGVYEECFLTIAGLAQVVDNNFLRYMSEFHPHLYSGLQNWQEYQVCSVAVGLVGDISRALSHQLLPYCDTIITLLLKNLANKHLDRSVKPPILSCFGDIALAIGGDFAKYLDIVMGMLKQASITVITTPLDSDDYMLIEYMNLLREGILEAYTGIIQGLRDGGKGDLIGPHVNDILQLIAHVATDKTRSDAVARAASGICGDLAMCIGDRIKPTLQQPLLRDLLMSTYHSTDSTDETKKTVQWALRVIDN